MSGPYLGIEIGGTKLQLGVGAGDGSPLLALDRFDVSPAQGAGGILRNIERAGSALVARHGVRGIGCGFGGPVDAGSGRVIKSHHVEGWEGFDLGVWLLKTLGVPAEIANDCDVAGLAEARFGAGAGKQVVFYVTVGTGIGGGLIVDGRIYRGSGLAVAEIGHLRPGLHADRPDDTVESLASGWGIAAAAQARLSNPVTHHISQFTHEPRVIKPEAMRQRLIEAEEQSEEHAADLLNRCGGDLERLTAKLVAQAAEGGNFVAQEVLNHAVQALGWAVAQTITLLAPQVVVIGGGVSLMPAPLFLAPLRTVAARYVFPPLADTYEILPAKLGEEVVIHGALALAKGR